MRRAARRTMRTAADPYPRNQGGYVPRKASERKLISGEPFFGDTATPMPLLQIVSSGTTYFLGSGVYPRNKRKMKVVVSVNHIYSESLSNEPYVLLQARTFYGFILRRCLPDFFLILRSIL